MEDEGPWSFAELAGAARSAEGQLAGLGVGAGQRVVVRVGNDERFLPGAMAVWALGAVAVLVHPATPEAELRRVAGAMEVTAVLVSDADTIPADAGVPVLALPPVPRGAEAPDAPSFRAPADVAGADAALVLLTSGTTGVPKGVVLTHDNAWANVRATVAAFRSNTAPSPLPERPKSPNLIANPVSHSGGLVRLLFGMYVGRGVVMLRKFNAPAAKRAIDRHGIDNLTINPTMLRMLLLDLPPDAHLGRVRYVSSGTAPLPEALRGRFEERFGVPVLQSYGQTESFGAIAIERATDVLAGRRRPGSVGRPLPGITVRVVDDVGDDVAPGEVGELWARSPAAAVSLLGAASESPVDADGWLHTGDLVRQDEDGYLFVVGRKRNVIICGGFNIVPEEIESVLSDVAGVREAAVVALPEDRLGEIPVALVVGDVSADEVMEAVRDKLLPYKRPRRVLVLDSLPKLPSGKVDKAATLALALALAPSADGGRRR